MDKRHQLILIEGEFIPEEGKEILTNIFSSKINFHQLKNFSTLERFGKEDAMAKIRVPALKEDMKKLEQIMDEADKQNKRLLINSVVHISIVD